MYIYPIQRHYPNATDCLLKHLWFMEERLEIGKKESKAREMFLTLELHIPKFQHCYNHIISQMNT